MTHPLDDPRAKLRRAEHHLLTLDGEWKAWQKSYPYYIAIQENEDQTFWEFSVRRFGAEIKPEDQVFGLLIGDYVHNLRAALDQLAPLGYLTVEQGMFLEGFQPYRRADFPKALPVLTAMWNADKHRLITPVEVRLVPEDGLVIEVVRDCKIVETYIDAEIPLEGDTKVGWARTETLGADPLVKVQNLRIQVLLGERKWRFGHLAALRDVTREIIEGCEGFF